MTKKELRSFKATRRVQKWIKEKIDPDLPDGILSVEEWEHSLEGDILTIWCESEVEEDSDYWREAEARGQDELAIDEYPYDEFYDI